MSAPVQLDLLDLLPPADPNAIQMLTCPACGYTARSDMHHMRMYHGWADPGGVCGSMDLRRCHVIAALRDGKALTEKHFGRGAFEQAMSRAVESWGARAREFVPAEYWPTDHLSTL